LTAASNHVKHAYSNDNKPKSKFWYLLVRWSSARRWRICDPQWTASEWRPMSSVFEVRFALLTDNGHLANAVDNLVSRWPDDADVRIQHRDMRRSRVIRSAPVATKTVRRRKSVSSGRCWRRYYDA